MLILVLKVDLEFSNLAASLTSPNTLFVGLFTPWIFYSQDVNMGTFPLQFLTFIVF